MADVQATRETHSTRADGVSETVGRVNVYDTNTTPPVTTGEQRSYAIDPAPATRSAPGLMTWLLILVAVVLALYFVVQVLT